MEELRDQGRWQALVGGHAGTGFVAMAATTKTVVESLAAAVNGEPAVMRKNDDLRPRPRDARAQNLH